MFAPGVGKDDGWYVIPGRLKDGSEVDLYFTRAGAPVSYRKPPLVSALYPNQRWRKFLMNLQGLPHLRYAWAQYICRDWNIAQNNLGTSKELVSFQIIYMRKLTLANYRTTAPQALALYLQYC